MRRRPDGPSVVVRVVVMVLMQALVSLAIGAWLVFMLEGDLDLLLPTP